MLLANSATKGSLLIVDDAPDNLRLLSEMLGRQGYEVRSAISGSLALTAVNTVPPDLILLDVTMPHMNGYEVCQQLKASEKTRDIPVIFLSALGETIDKVKAFQIGGIDYITKPFHLAEVLARVETQLRLQQMQRQLQQAKDEALLLLAKEQELSRLKSEFVAMVSHDFRTPLTTIQGFSELLCSYRDALPIAKQMDYFDRINSAVEEMLALLDEVLFIGSVEAGGILYKATPIDLEALCRDLIETVQMSQGSQHSIRFAYFGTEVLVETDRQCWQKILTNLLSNAIKYSPAESLVQIELHCHEVIVLRVTDQGIGIPAVNQAHLFEPFYRCCNVGDVKGTGLGLAIVRRCVELLHGQITVQSGDGQGTTFTITLPKRTSDGASHRNRALTYARDLEAS